MQRAPGKWDEDLAYNRADLEGIHQHSMRHRERVERSAQCGCFYCLTTFAPVEIMNWVDLPEGEEDEEKGVTALCPNCGIDAVLPDNVPGAPLSAELLEVMRQFWFESFIRLGKALGTTALILVCFYIMRFPKLQDK